MMKIIRHLFLVLMVSFSMNVESCMEPTYPDLENLDKYSEIFIGEVTGVMLDYYERNLLFRLKRKDKSIEVDETKKGYLLRAVIEKQIKGKTENPYQTKILDCGIRSPNLRTHGIFFVENDTGRLIIIFEDQGDIYYESIIATNNDTY